VAADTPMRDFLSRRPCEAAETVDCANYSQSAFVLRRLATLRRYGDSS
jgi:hypothetical protein